MITMVDSLLRDHTRACYIYIALEDDSATASSINLIVGGVTHIRSFLCCCMVLVLGFPSSDEICPVC